MKYVFFVYPKMEQGKGKKQCTHFINRIGVLGSAATNL